MSGMYTIWILAYLLNKSLLINIKAQMYRFGV